MMREKGRAAIYGLAGFYVWYLAYQMFGARNDGGGNNYVLMLVFSLLFVLAGGAMLFLAYRMIRQGQKNTEPEKVNDTMQPETEIRAADSIPEEEVKQSERMKKGSGEL